MTLRNCGDCGAVPGEMHVGGCDMEHCARCGGQSISCNCIYEVCGMNPATLEVEHPDVYGNGPTREMCDEWDRGWLHRRMPWTGEYSGKPECREYGFWCVWGPPWISVPAGTDGAVEDLNRLSPECDWDAGKQRWVLRS